MTKYKLDDTWFEENGSDSVEYMRATSKMTVTVSPELNMSESFLKLLYDMGKPYVIKKGGKIKNKKKSVKNKVDEPKEETKEKFTNEGGE
tara:strand:- start:1991 stop:2260 length:270 start_codon:yes stop_codon:yes gene_type:complete